MKSTLTTQVSEMRFAQLQIALEHLYQIASCNLILTGDTVWHAREAIRKINEIEKKFDERQKTP